jgi:undecaprenyl-diphosphatase
LSLFISVISVLGLDEQLFIFINSAMSHPILDFVLIPIRDKTFWIPLYVFILSFVFFNLETKKRWFFLYLILVITLADQLSSSVIKKNVERIRPCNEQHLVGQVVERVHCGRGYSFTSSHATNHFAIATYLFFTLGSYLLLFRWPILIWASLISFAQIYVGVHYPLDVFCGALLGIVIGYSVFTLKNLLNSNQ